MANRPIFRTFESAPYYLTTEIEFDWVKGMALSQQQKRVIALHDAFHYRFPDKQILEISSKSSEAHGIDASAFNLKKFVPSLGKSVSVENIYQGSKVFEQGGPFTDILEKTSKEAKGDERLKNSGPLIAFRFENCDYPLNPKNIFYDFLYISALMENEELAEKIKQYDAFSDIAFNPQKSTNCQARAAAIFVSLSRLGKLDEVKDFQSFAALFKLKNITPVETAKRSLPILKVSAVVQDHAPVSSEQTVGKGDIIEHLFFKTGEVLSDPCDGSIRVLFATVGEKKLSYSWVLQNCKIIR